MIGLAILAGFALLFWLVMLRPMDELSITVTNHTGRQIEMAGIFDQVTDNRGILTIGPLAPGQTATASTHFGKDYGTCPFVIKQDGISRSDSIGVLLNDNGPFNYDITVDAAGDHVKSDVASKGSGTFDLNLSP